MKRVVRVLVVEDVYLIAVELEEILTGHGFLVLGPIGTVDGALELLRRELPDAAVLDLNLQGRSAIPVARLMRQMNVPFVLATAYSKASLLLDEALLGILNVGKPVHIPTLLSALHEIIEGRP